MAQTKYLDEAGLVTLVTNIKNEDKAIKDLIGTVPAKVGDTTTATVIAYVDAKAAAAQTSATYDDTALANRVTTLEGLHNKVDNSFQTVAKEVEAEKNRAQEVESGLLEDIGALQDLVGTTSVDAKIEALNATVRGNLTDADAIASGKKVGVKVVEANGKLTGVTVVENDIASASELSALKTLVGDTAVATQISNAVSGATDANSALGKAVAANTAAITTLNGSGAGSVANTVATEIAKIVNENNNGSIDTLNEIASWIINDTTGAAKMAKDINDNADAISALQTAGGQPNVIDSVKLKTGTAAATALTVTDKAVTIDVSGKSDVGHKHVAADITDFATEVEKLKPTTAGTADVANALASTATVAGSQVDGAVANATNATTADTANALATTATVQGSQVSGAVASATNATNADKATKDGNGDTISTTYVKLADIGSIPDADINALFNPTAQA